MKLILEFDGISEREEHDDAINGTKYKCIIDDLFNYLRTKRKYEDKTSIKIAELEEWLRLELE